VTPDPYSVAVYFFARLPMHHSGKISRRPSRKRPLEHEAANLDSFLREALAVCFQGDPGLATTLATILELELEIRRPHLLRAETRTDSLMTSLRMLVHAATEVEDTNCWQILKCIELLADHMDFASRSQARLH
jgi:hypothetical protein